MLKNYAIEQLRRWRARTEPWDYAMCSLGMLRLVIYVIEGIKGSGLRLETWGFPLRSSGGKKAKGLWNCIIQGIKVEAWYLRLHSAQRRLNEGRDCAVLELKGQDWALGLCNAQLRKVGTTNCIVPRDKFEAWGIWLRSVQFKKAEWGHVSQAGTFPGFAKCGISGTKVNNDKT